MITTITEVRKILKENVDENVLKTSAHFFKQDEGALVHGVKTDKVNQIGKELYKQIKGKYSKREIFKICDELWKSQYLEESFIACILSKSLEKQYDGSDFQVFEAWVMKYVNNWAACDTLCNHTVGAFVMMYPEYIKDLKKWAKLDFDINKLSNSERWIKRAAAVSLIIPARKGMFLQDIFEIADILLLASEDIVQKGYGWMLKAASEVYQLEVFDYVISKIAIMPRTALRYAIEKMPKELKIEAMKK